MTAKAKPGGGSEWADLDGEQMLEVDSVCSRVAKAWKQGQGPQIEACLSGANPQLRSVLFKELLLLECSCRRKRGESPEQHDYTARFPEYQDLIAQVFTAEGQNPSVIGGYEIREEVGKGSFGVVYRAYDRGLGRHVAIKLIQPDRRNQDDLLRAQTWEGRLQAKLIHENIVRIHGTGVDPQHGPFIVFEYVDGKSLREELRGRDGGRFSVPEAIRIAAGIADAISHAHACSVIHRDLKPANILIDRAGTPFVTDFGLAIHDFSRRSSEGQVAGTEAYMAPEQRHGKPDAASDVWALGVILYEMLTGNRPFAEPAEEDHPRQWQKVTPPSRICPAVKPTVDDLCLHCLRESPQERTTAKRLADELRSLADASTKGVWIMPHRRNPFFTGRTAELQQLAERLEEDRIAAVVGLGGRGKTQIVVEYICSHEGDYRDVFWCAADSRSSLETAFWQIADRLELPERRSDRSQGVFEAVKRWLCQNANWLLVFDAADDPQLLRQWLPTRSGGRVIVTSRSPQIDCLGILSTISLKDLNEGEALDFLENRTARHGSPAFDRSAAAQLAGELGYLPLAIEQAAAYIYAQQVSLQEYLTSFRKRRLQLLQRSRPTAADYPETVATTWSLSFELVQQASAASADLLRLCAFLSPDGIPDELVVLGRHWLGTNIEKALEDIDDEPVVLGELLAPLSRYSLVDRDRDSRACSMHCLVQEVIVDSLTAADAACWLERLVLAISEVSPNDCAASAYGSWFRLVPHIKRVLAHVIGFGLTTPAGAPLARRLAEFCHKTGRFRQACDWYQKAIGPLRSDELSGRLDAASAYHGLAQSCAALGQYDDAVQHIQHGLDTAANVGGSDANRIVASCLSTRGDLFRAQGHLDKAEADHRRAVEIGERVFGTDDPSLAVLLNSLAQDMREKQRPSESLPLQQLAVDIAEKASGEGHDILSPLLLRLGDDYALCQQPAQAERCYRRAMQAAEATEGKEHPYWAHSAIRLAEVLEASGNYTEAVAAYTAAASVYANVFGESSRHHLHSLTKLARCQQSSQNRSGSEELLRKAISISQGLREEPHIDIALARTDLAALCIKLAFYEEAADLLEHAIGTAECLGSPCGFGFAERFLPELIALSELGLLDRAADLLRRAVAFFEPGSARQNPVELTCLKYLGIVEAKRSNFSEAERFFVRGLDAAERWRGPKREQILKAFRSCLADLDFLRGKAATDSHRIAGPPKGNARRGVGRNEMCPCNSGKKYKNCCMRKRQSP